MFHETDEVYLKSLQNKQPENNFFFQNSIFFGEKQLFGLLCFFLSDLKYERKAFLFKKRNKN